MNQVLKELGKAGLVPVITISNARDAVPLAESLLHGGLPVVEITFRTPAAEEAIKRIAAEIPALVLGAGTVLNVQQAQQAVAAGARYIVSPGYDAGVVDWCLEHDVAVTPGVATPTEIMMALAKGLSVLKFFPAEELGGVKMLEAMSGPFPDVRFIPSGGITAATLPEYLRLPNVFAVGGSWMASNRLIASGEFGEIMRLAGEASKAVRQARTHKTR